MSPWKTSLAAIAVVGTILAVSAIAISYSTGPGNCSYPTSAMGESGTGTGGFVIAVTQNDEAVTEYLPGQTYTVTLSAPTEYRGFLLQSVAGDPGAPDVDAAGEFVDLADGYVNGPCTVATASVGHSIARRGTPATSDSFSWVAPDQGTGPVTFHAVGVFSRFDWYGQETLITTTLAEGMAVDGDVSDFTTLKSRF